MNWERPQTGRGARVAVQNQGIETGEATTVLDCTSLGEETDDKRATKYDHRGDHFTSWL